MEGSKRDRVYGEPPAVPSSSLGDAQQPSVVSAPPLDVEPVQSPGHGTYLEYNHSQHHHGSETGGATLIPPREADGKHASTASSGSTAVPSPESSSGESSLRRESNPGQTRSQDEHHEEHLDEVPPLLSEGVNEKGTGYEPIRSGPSQPLRRPGLATTGSSARLVELCTIWRGTSHSTLGEELSRFPAALATRSSLVHVLKALWAALTHSSGCFFNSHTRANG